jgi:hypothetical protein
MTILTKGDYLWCNNFLELILRISSSNDGKDTLGDRSDESSDGEEQDEDFSGSLRKRTRVP